MWLTPLLAFLACAGSRAPIPPTEAARDLPRLVAPEATVYGAHPGTSPDPAVAALAQGLPWEESLSGAAGALAMDLLRDLPPDAWRARWAAWRAGYPYPLEVLEVDACALGCLPRSLVDRVQDDLGPGTHLGLARARGGDQDVWVALVGRPGLPLAPVPRVVPPNTTVTIAPVGGAAPADVRVRTVSPSGLLEEAPLGAGVQQDVAAAGEWWVEVGRGDGIVAGFPLYVDMDPPAGPPLEGVSGAAGSAAEAEDVAWELLAHVRDTFAWAPPEEDPVLDAAARARVRAVLDAEGPRSGELRPPTGACRASLACTVSAGEGVDDCFQAWLVDARARAPLLDPGCATAGVAAGSTGEQLLLFLELGPR